MTERQDQTDRYHAVAVPIATDLLLRGINLATDRLVQKDCFTDRTLRILDELRAEVISVGSPSKPHFQEEA